MHYISHSDFALKFRVILKLPSITAGLGRHNQTCKLQQHSRSALGTGDSTASIRETESFGPFSSPVWGSQYQACTIQGCTQANPLLVGKNCKITAVYNIISQIQYQYTAALHSFIT